MASVSVTPNETILDVTRLRQSFPGLRADLARFDGPGGSLVPQVVADAVAGALQAGLCQRGGPSAPGLLTDEITLGARAAMARFVGLGDARGVVFGRSMTALTFDLARTLSADWGPGDEVVVSRLDHDANIRPWTTAAQRAGATVRWLDFDPGTGELDDIEPVLSDRTRVVALTAASNLIGTRPDVAALSRTARRAGALVYVDAVHLAAHSPLDITALGADVLVCSPYKFFGPHLGILAADPALLEGLHPDKLLPSSDAVPERFELGTLPYELLAGVTAAVGFAEECDMRAVEQHEQGLLERLLDGLAALPRVTVHGRPRRRTPTVLLTVADLTPIEVSHRLHERGIMAPAGSFYALEAARRAGLGDAGGVRVGISAYTDTDEIDRLLHAVEDL